MNQLSDYQLVPGQLIALELILTTLNGVPGEPGELAMTIELPNGARASYAKSDLMFITPGVYRLLFYVAEHGRYFVYCHSSGIPDAAAEGYFDVAWSRFV